MENNTLIIGGGHGGGKTAAMQKQIENLNAEMVADYHDEEEVKAEAEPVEVETLLMRAARVAIDSFPPGDRKKLKKINEGIGIAKEFQLIIEKKSEESAHNRDIVQQYVYRARIMKERFEEKERKSLN